MPRTAREGALKTTITLPEDMVAVLRELAAARNVSFVEVVRRAITVEKYLSDARNDGCRILVEDPEKLIKEIVIF
jgi:Ribbon-helix-helix protein, copG family